MPGTRPTSSLHCSISPKYSFKQYLISAIPKLSSGFYPFVFVVHDQCGQRNNWLSLNDLILSAALESFITGIRISIKSDRTAQVYHESAATLPLRFKQTTDRNCLPSKVHGDTNVIDNVINNQNTIRCKHRVCSVACLMKCDF